MTRVETFFLGLWLFLYGLWFGFEPRIGGVVMLYVTLLLPLADYVNAKLKRPPAQRQS